MRPKIIITLIALLIGMVVAAIGQNSGPGMKTVPVTLYVPNEVQQLKLQVRQKDAQLAQVALREAQSNFQQKVKELMEEGIEVRKANGWPDKVTMNPDSLTFSPVAEDAKKEPVKP